MHVVSRQKVKFVIPEVFIGNPVFLKLAFLDSRSTDGGNDAYELLRKPLA
jgi:hypothetical protein